MKDYSEHLETNSHQHTQAHNMKSCFVTIVLQRLLDQGWLYIMFRLFTSSSCVFLPILTNYIFDNRHWSYFMLSAPIYTDQRHYLS